jgi:hypothetical protein
LRNKIINAKRIISLIKQKFNVSLSLSYFYSLLKKMKLTNKKVYIKKQPYSNKEYDLMKKKFFEQIKHIDKNNIISIDETLGWNATLLHSNPKLIPQGETPCPKFAERQILGRLERELCSQFLLLFLLH